MASILADKPRLLLLSSVFPFPRKTGQQQRVYYTIKALRERFHVTFLSFAAYGKLAEVEAKLLEQCDDVILLPSIYTKNCWTKKFYKLLGLVFVLSSGLKFSNYLIGELEFAPSRLATILDFKKFDCVLFEYWHAAEAVSFFRKMGILTILDMHDILWQSYTHQLNAKPNVPKWWKQRIIQKYKEKEERAWKSFDALIAINQAELEYVRRVVNTPHLFYAPMGTDIDIWPYCWQPASPPRIAYYGSLGSHHNQQDALICYHEIMSHIWQEYPDVEFWIIGSNPPNFIQALTHDKRVRVPGFIEQVQDVLKTMYLVLCPWSGTYGFRSRVIELMALGNPVIASEEAVFGMGFEIGQGIFLGKTPLEMSQISLKLLSDTNYAKRHSQLGRLQIENKFSFEATYKKFSQELFAFNDVNKTKG